MPSDNKPAKLRHKDRDARGTVKFTKAKPQEDGTMPAVGLANLVYNIRRVIYLERIATV